MAAIAPRPEHVFTPRDKPTREMFSTRDEADLSGKPDLQTTVTDALRDVGAQLLLYGDPGVGKSSLLSYCATDDGLEVLAISCLSRWSFDEHVDAALRELLDEQQVDSSREIARTGGLDAGLSSPVQLRANRLAKRAETRRYRKMTRIPLLQLAESMHDARVGLIIFDNFHNVRPDQREAFAQAIEVLSDRAAETGNVKMALVGVPEDAESLVGTSGSVGRRLIEVGVPRMPDRGIRHIIRTGLALLSLSIDDEALVRMTFFCDGFPFLAHALGLAVSRNAIRAEKLLIDVGDVDRGLQQTAKSVEASYPERFKAAFRDDEGRTRRRLIQTLARTRQVQWSLGDIRKRYTREHVLHWESQLPDLDEALDALVRQDCGALLVRAKRSGELTYRFSDAYVRLCAQMLDLTEQTAADDAPGA